jgi:basic secretory peptidase family protein
MPRFVDAFFNHARPAREHLLAITRCAAAVRSLFFAACLLAMVVSSAIGQRAERGDARANYDASYRITGNFLDWATTHHDRELVPELNAAAREGRYTEQLWQDWTGRTVQDLGEEWRKANADRLGAAKP